MFTLIPLKSIKRCSSFKIDNLVVENGSNITGIFREIHGPKTKSSIHDKTIHERKA